MFKRNPGRFKYTVTLMKPSAPKRDELGGIQGTEYTAALTLQAMCEVRNQSRQQVAGDFLTVDTRFFVVRDLKGTAAEGVDTSWRLTCNGRTYLINDVLPIEESVPYFVQITATALNGGGGM